MKSPTYQADRICNELAAAQNGAVTRPQLLGPPTKTHESAIAEVRQVKHRPSDEIATLPTTSVVPGAFLLRATSPARSLVDLSIWTPPSQWDQFERILDAAHRLRIAFYHDVLRSVERARILRRRVMRAITALLATLAGRQLLEAASELEALAQRRFARYGVGSLVEFEMPHPAYLGTSRRADGVCRSTRVIFEFDSRAFHLRDAQFAADRARNARSAELGWITVRLTWVDFTAHDAMTRARVRRMCGLDGGLRPAA